MSALAQLLASWSKSGELDERELVTLALESIRDDLPQAKTKDGRRVTDIRSVLDYLNDVIAELRKLNGKPSSVRKLSRTFRKS